MSSTANSEQQTYNEMNADRKTLVCYEDVRDVFLSRKESVFPMENHLDMGNQFIYNVKTPVNNDQGATKSYVDQKVTKSGDTMSGIVDMGGNEITGLFQIPPTLFQPPQNPTDTNMQKYFEDLRKNTTHDNHTSPFLIMKNFLSTSHLLNYSVQTTTTTIRWV